MPKRRPKKQPLEIEPDDHISNLGDSSGSDDGSVSSEEFSNDDRSRGSRSYSSRGSGSRSSRSGSRGSRSRGSRSRGSGSYSGSGSYDDDDEYGRRRSYRDDRGGGGSYRGDSRRGGYRDGEDGHYEDEREMYMHQRERDQREMYAQQQQQQQQSRRNPDEFRDPLHERIRQREERREKRAEERRLRDQKKLYNNLFFAVLAAALIFFVIAFFTFPALRNGLAKDDDDGDKEPERVEDPGPTELPTYTAIEALVRAEIALDKGKEFALPDSYQSKALKFLVDHEAKYEEVTKERLRQTYALLCLYYATNGERWNPSMEWLHHRKEKNECAWTGVRCNRFHEVEHIYLTSAKLAGVLPAELQLLSPKLEELGVDDNPGLSGTIPEFLGTMGLRSLSMTGCNYGGNLPPSICTYLKENTVLFTLQIDCEKVLCQPTCCDFCY